MKTEVEQAIEEIRRMFPDCQVDVEADPEGGAYVTVGNVDLGPAYIPSGSWCGFRITFQHPFADVYPHFFAANLARKDGQPLGAGFHGSKEWKTPTRTLPATMVSRRSRRRDPTLDTPAVKLAKVIDWIRSL